MLESRNIISTLSQQTLKVYAAKGQGSVNVLSSLLWSLVMDDLL
jgi:drug/metabolite transporter superfamily protein YnfA